MECLEKKSECILLGENLISGGIQPAENGDFATNTKACDQVDFVLQKVQDGTWNVWKRGVNVYCREKTLYREEYEEPADNGDLTTDTKDCDQVDFVLQKVQDGAWNVWKRRVNVYYWEKTLYREKYEEPADNGDLTTDTKACDQVDFVINKVQDGAWNVWKRRVNVYHREKTCTLGGT